jgi:hypothetical protein
LAVVADNVSEDWIVFKKVDGGFDFWSTICPEESLPNPHDHVGIRDYPVGLTRSITAPTLSLASASAKVHQYGNRESVVKQNEMNVAGEQDGGVKQDLVMKIVNDSEYKEPEQAVQDVITVCGGRVRGSCGAPYFTSNGEVVAFHIFSINDSEDDLSSSSNHSHLSYSQGYVLSRLPGFCNWRISLATSVDSDYVDGMPVDG